MTDINKVALEKIKQATYFLDEKHQRPLQLATTYIEVQLMSQVLQSQDNNAKISSFMQMLAPNIGKEKIALIQMLLTLNDIEGEANEP